MRRRQFKNNSIGSALRLPTITLLLFGCVFLLGTSSALAVTMEIQFTGVNLSYDPNTISDAESPAGGTGDPNDADPLDSIQFKVGGDLKGTAFTDDIFLDVSIPGVTNLPNSGSEIVTTSVSGGYFHLLIDTDPNAPNAEEFLKLDIDEVTITYLNITGTVQFMFGAAVVENYSQNLPFGLEIGDPVTVSFSTQVDVGSKTIAGGFVTGFTSWGTGEVVGTFVPEPSSCVLGAIGLAASCAFRRCCW